MRPRHIEGLDSANRTEQVLRRVCVESVRGQYVAAGEQLETICRHDKVQVARFAANRAIALGKLKLCRCEHLESDSPAVTTSSMHNHVIELLRHDVVSAK